MDTSFLRALFVLAGLVAYYGATPAHAADAVEIQRLAQGLRSSDPTTRYRSSLALAGIGAPAAPALIEALRDPDWQARIAAANALRDMKGAAAPAMSRLAARAGQTRRQPVVSWRIARYNGCSRPGASV